MTAAHFKPGIILLAGTAEARALSLALTQRGWPHKVVINRQDRLRANWGEEVIALGRWLEASFLFDNKGFACVVDARHPFDQRDAEALDRLSLSAGLRSLRLRRQPWRPTDRDRWVQVRNEDQIHKVVPKGARLLVATGRDGIKPLARLKDCYVLVRQLEGHSGHFPLPRGRWLFGGSPFSVTQEVALMRRLRIDGLVVRNAGGRGAWPKLAGSAQARLARGSD